MNDYLNFKIDVYGKTLRLKHAQRGILLEYTFVRSPSVNDLPQFIKQVMKDYTRDYNKGIIKSRPLKKRQRELYTIILNFWKTEKRPPSFQEMADAMGVASKGTPYVICKKLEEYGWIWKDEDGIVIPVDIQTPDMAE